MEKVELSPVEKHQANEKMLAAIFGGRALRCYPYVYREKEEDKEGEVVEITVFGEVYQVLKIFLDKEIQEVFVILNEREKRALELRFGLEDGKWRTYEEIRPEFGVTRSRIGQIIHRALRKLRHPSRSRRLKDFLMPTPERLFEDKIRWRERIGTLDRSVDRLENENRQLRREKEELELRLKRLGLEIKIPIEKIPTEKLPTLEELAQFKALVTRFPNNRVWNAVERAGITQVSELRALVVNGDIRYFRSIGDKAVEFLSVVLETTEQIEGAPS